MLFSWFRRSARRPSRTTRPAAAPLRVEALEERTVPAGTVSILTVQGPSALSTAVPAAIEGRTANPSFNATFTDSNAIVPQNLKVTIDYGDGTPLQSNQTGPTFDPNLIVSQSKSNPTQFTVTDAHVFAEGSASVAGGSNPGVYPITLTVTEVANPANTDTDTTGTAKVLDAPLSAGSALANVSATTGKAFTGVVANFSDANPNGTAADYRAVITWGDGHQSNGTIEATNGGFNVVGTNTYATAGTFTVAVAIIDRDADGSQPPLQINTSLTVSAAGTTAQQTQSTTTTTTTTAKTAPGKPSVSEAFGPGGRYALLVVSSTGTLTQYDTYGTHVLGGGVSSASVAFDAQGREIILIVRPDGTLTQYDSFGPHALGGGVSNASVAFDQNGREVIVVVRPDGSLTQYDANGAHVLGSGVKFASVGYSAAGEVLVIGHTDGTLTQTDALGVHALGSGVDWASVAYAPYGEVVDVIAADGTLIQYDRAGAHALGHVA